MCGSCHILLMVMVTVITVTAANNNSVSPSNIHGDVDRVDHILQESSTASSSEIDTQSVTSSRRLWQQPVTHPMKKTQQVDNSSSSELGLVLGAIEKTVVDSNYLPKFPYRFDIILTEDVPAFDLDATTTEMSLNATADSLRNSSPLSFNDLLQKYRSEVSNSSKAFNSSVCFCKQCVAYTETALDNTTVNLQPECCYVKQFLNSGNLSIGILALKVLQQCIANETQYINFQSVVHNNTYSVLLPEVNRVKLKELKQAECMLRSLENVYVWRKNYEAVRKNFIGDNDRHFDSVRYRNLLASLESTLESLPKFLNAADEMDAVGSACLDINWAPVFTSAIGSNRSDFECFLREEQSKMQRTLWTGLMFRNYLDPIVYSLMIFFGILSNGALLLMFLRYKEMQSQRNVLLLNLIVLDLMNLTTVAPLYLLSKYYSSNLYIGEYGCRVFLCYRIIVRYCIEFSLAALTVQRYSAMTSHRLSNRTRAAFYILGVWVAAVISTLPHSLAFVFRDVSCFSFRKDPSEVDFLIDHVLMMFLSLFLPVVVFILSILMARRLKHSVREMPSDGRQTLQKQEFARKRSARVVVALALVFAFTHTPRALWFGLVPWSTIDRQSAAFLWIDGVMNYLYYLNSGLNPCAMYFSCSIFRRLSKIYFVCCYREHKTEDSNQSQRTHQFVITQSCHM